QIRAVPQAKKRLLDQLFRDAWIGDHAQNQTVNEHAIRVVGFRQSLRVAFCEASKQFRVVAQTRDEEREHDKDAHEESSQWTHNLIPQAASQGNRKESQPLKSLSVTTIGDDRVFKYARRAFSADVRRPYLPY